jgi:hypothetical protein
MLLFLCRFLKWSTRSFCLKFMLFYRTGTRLILNLNIWIQSQSTSFNCSCEFLKTMVVCSAFYVAQNIYFICLKTYNNRKFRVPRTQGPFFGCWSVASQRLNNIFEEHKISWSTDEHGNLFQNCRTEIILEKVYFHW